MADYVDTPAPADDHEDTPALAEADDHEDTPALVEADDCEGMPALVERDDYYEVMPALEDDQDDILERESWRNIEDYTSRTNDHEDSSDDPDEQEAFRQWYKQHRQVRVIPGMTLPLYDPRYDLSILWGGLGGFHFYAIPL